MDNRSAEDREQKRKQDEQATNDDEKSEESEGGKESSDTMKRPARQKREFPWKLHVMLEDAERENNQHIVSWDSEGKSFKVFKVGEFVKQILPRYFNHKQFRSFQRMVSVFCLFLKKLHTNLYFCRLT